MNNSTRLMRLALQHDELPMEDREWLIDLAVDYRIAEREEEQRARECEILSAALQGFGYNLDEART